MKNETTLTSIGIPLPSGPLPCDFLVGALKWVWLCVPLQYFSVGVFACKVLDVTPWLCSVWTVCLCRETDPVLGDEVFCVFLTTHTAGGNSLLPLFRWWSFIKKEIIWFRMLLKTHELMVTLKQKKSSKLSHNHWHQWISCWIHIVLYYLFVLLKNMSSS